MKRVAAYVRVSSSDQNDTLQVDAINRWAKTHHRDVKIYHDKFTGTTMNRPGWNALWKQVLANKIERIVVWKLDRLGRSAAELTKLFDWLVEAGITLTSITDGLDLLTTNGRLFARILAAVAEFEREVRKERQMAGIQAYRDRNGGRGPGGIKKGQKLKPRERQRKLARCAELSLMGLRDAEVAAAMGVTRMTVLRWKKEIEDNASKA